MMLFANQTVQDFFEEANWHGDKITLNDIPINLNQVVKKRIEVNLGLTVEEYFSLSNWQGVSFTETDVREETSSASVSEVFSLNVSVTQFFQTMVWEKQILPKEVKIAVPPEKVVAKISEIPSEKQQFNVQDLSDLF